MSKIKLERIASNITKELSQILYENAHNEVLKNITIIETKVTNDISLAKVYYSYLKDYDKIFVAEELKKASPFLRCELAKRLKIRTIPELKFVYDESTEYGEHIDQIIEEIHKENEQ